MLSPYFGAIIAAGMLTLFATLFSLDERRKARAKKGV